MEKIKSIKSIFKTIAICLALVGGSVFVGILLKATFFASTDGIYAIGSEAVYIAGESCTINAKLARSMEQLRKDAEMCITYHGLYRKLDAYNHPSPEQTTISAILKH